MVKRRVVRMLLVPNRTDYYLDQGEPKGLTAAYANELGRRLNAQYKTGPRPIQVAFVPVTRDRLLPSLLEGKGDIAVANLTITPERQKLVDFSPPFLTDVREIVVTGPGAPPLASLEDLAGMEVPARRSSSYWPSLEALSGQLRREHLAGITLEPLPEVVEDEDLLELVNAGMLPLIVVDEHKAKAWAEALPSIGLRDDLVLRSGGQIAWAYRKRSPKLADFLASFAKATARGTEFGNIVGDRYLVDAEQLRHNGPDDQRRFLQLLAQFRRFGDRYRFDPLLLAAQGFQESGLDQSKRNPGGADRHHAAAARDGARSERRHPWYRPGREQYRGRRQVPAPPDRRLFRRPRPWTSSTACCSRWPPTMPGQSRIADLRRRAAGRGLDPNRWFGQVELQAARDIGRETVTYVGNIVKYYVVYRGITEQEDARSVARSLIVAR